MMLFAVILTIAAMLVACEQRVINTTCATMTRITFDDRADSRETINQVRRHNASWSAQCP